MVGIFRVYICRLFNTMQLTLIVTGFQAFTRADKDGCAYTFMEYVGVLFKVGWFNEIRMFRSHGSRPYVHEYTYESL